MKNNYNIVILIITIISITNNYAQTPGAMEFGNSLVVLANTANPNVNQSANSLLNNFNVSGVSSETTAPIFLALAPSGNGAGTEATASEEEAVLGWFGNGNVAVSSATLATNNGAETKINSLDFAYQRAVGNETLNFTFTGKKDGIEVGTLQLNMPAHNTLLSIDLSNTTTGTFSDIDEIVITPESPIFGGFTIDNLEIATATTVSSAYTWSGTTDNNWQTASNWIGNAAPPISANVIVPNNVTNYPTISSAVTVNSIDIASGASLIANASVTGNVTYNRNLPTTNWYLVATPVLGETQQDIIANNSFATGTGSNIGIGTFSNNTGPSWIYATNLSTGNVFPGFGVSVKLDTPGDLSITGNAVTTNVTIPVTVGTRNSFNLLGNPYTSYINSAVLAGNNSVISNSTFWLWDGSQYVTYNNTNPVNIAPAQGFFIEAGSSNDVIFSTANQSHQNTDTFLKSTTSNASFELLVENNSVKRAAKVFYIEGKTTGFDNGYDSKMFDGVAQDFGIYTELLANNKGEKLAIQTLPSDNYNNLVIPVGVIANAGEEIVFSLKENNIPKGLNIYLEDRVTNTFVKFNQKNANYKIVLSKKTNNTGRFYIHTLSKALSTASEIADNVNIFKANNTTLKITGLQNGTSSVIIYNAIGKQVLSTSFIANGNNSISLPNLAAGVYIVKLQNEKIAVNKKIIIE
ncbi:T9SS type A sorting domain-containing protein [uncultured Polaribacter sp.]|uniref:T9SS type A sorting domain-containing protein n=1 Tax=uncultured Polaribacter sp. TaxID=174711 RepID=UPI00261E088A|nr:T9SS type A sorting domain-containing protein [uncultured Polaribacter sp.]